MVALAEDEALITRLFQYRFSSGRGLKGHSFGNLFLTAMTHLTGDFAHAVTLSSQVLSVLGRIYPATSANVVLEATLADGRYDQQAKPASAAVHRAYRAHHAAAPANPNRWPRRFALSPTPI